MKKYKGDLFGDSDKLTRRMRIKAKAQKKNKEDKRRDWDDVEEVNGEDQEFYTYDYNEDGEEGVLL